MAWQKLEEAGEQMRVASYAASDQINSSWDDFPVRCPRCFTTMQPPSSSGDSPAFNCIKCQVLLKTPTNVEKAFFHSESALVHGADKFRSFFGGRIVTYVPSTVPAGKQSGDSMDIDFNGKTYNLKIPQGLKEGDAFRIRLDVTDNPPRRIYPCELAKIGVGSPLPVDGNQAQDHTVQVKTTTAAVGSGADVNTNESEKTFTVEDKKQTQTQLETA